MHTCIPAHVKLVSSFLYVCNSYDNSWNYVPASTNNSINSYFPCSYFVYSFMGSPNLFADIKDECTRDVDVIRHAIAPAFWDLPHDCTLHEEMNPPALRKSVQNLLEVSKKNKAKTKPFYWHVKKWNYYDPLM